MIEQAGRARLLAAPGDVGCPLVSSRAIARGARRVAARGSRHPSGMCCSDAAWATCRTQEPVERESLVIGQDGGGLPLERTLGGDARLDAQAVERITGCNKMFPDR